MVRIFRIAPGIAVSAMPKEKDLAQMDEFDWLVTLSKKRPPMIIQDNFGDNYRYCPIKDGRIRDVEPLYHAMAIVARAASDGEDVLIHCLAGRNRSMLIAALAMRSMNGMSGEAAYQRIMELRPNALHNVFFERFLRALP